MKDAIILGIIQGIFEWFPVSSSGHLIIFQKLLNLKTDISFDIFLHLSSLFAICVFFWKDIKNIGIKFFTFRKETYEFKIGLYIIIATFITGLSGLFLNNFIGIFENLLFLSGSFFFTSILLFSTKFIKERERKINSKIAAVIGVFQGLALIPGISRSGSTITACKIFHINQKDTFRFSFLIAIPAILGAVILKIGEIKSISFPVLITGFSISFFLSLISLFLLRKVFLKGKFYLFGIYTLMVSIFLLFIQCSS